MRSLLMEESDVQFGMPQFEIEEDAKLQGQIESRIIKRLLRSGMQCSSLVMGSKIESSRVV